MRTPEVVENILDHHGTKGMHWGERRAQKRLDKQERRFDKTFASKGRTNQLKVELHNSVGPVVQSKVNQLNASPKYSKAISSGRLKDANDPITKQYINDFNKIYLNEMNGYLKGFQSPMGKTVKAELNSQDFLGFSLKVQNAQGAKKIKHADGNDLLVRVNYIKDKDGRIIDTEVVEDDLAQSSINNILEHHGVKGMRWGVRRKATVGPQEVIVSDRRKKIKTSGGSGHPAHSDAVRARTTAQVAKKSGLKALSNKELQDFNNRLNLEQNAKRLTFQDKSAGKKFVLTMLGRKAPGAAEAGAKVALNSARARKLRAVGHAAVALA